MTSDYKITYSGRKTIGLYIRNGKVEVRAPLNCDTHFIQKFVQAKKSWIEKTIHLQSTRAVVPALGYGSGISICGDMHTIVAADKYGIMDGKIFVPPGLAADALSNACKILLQKFAQEYLPNRVELFANKMGVSPSKIRIGNAKTSWGSCSSSGSITLSWRLIMCDLSCIDYVVVHELAHLTHMNHSSKFWSVVANVLPDYKMRNMMLKKLGSNISAQGW